MRLELLNRVVDGASPIPPFDDVLRYREMRAEYLDRCARLPAINRYNIVLMVCAHGFGVSVDALISHDKSVAITETRQKLMAFSRIVSLGTARLNTWKGIARTFHRSHSTVIHATQKYGKSIQAALEVSK